MVEAALRRPDTSRSTRRVPRWASGTLRSALSFILIVGLLIIVWEGIKARYELADYILPHTWSIIGTLGQPVQENGPTLLEILTRAALFTWGEAAIGFVLGSVVGLALAVIFSQSGLLQRGLMPFVVASQTVPILALAPMVVIGMSSLGTPRWFSVSLIAAYLSFFPVTISTLRGLTSISPTAHELFASYASRRGQILRKLSVPNALPYIFTALKISATASIVGAIIGELPSGIQDGLGGSILNFNQYYNSAPPRLWATILIAAVLGIAFYALVAIVERLVIRWAPPDRSKA